MAAQFGAAAQILKQLGEDGCQPRRMHFGAGQVVHDANAAADSFFLIESGEVRLYHALDGGDFRLLDILGPDDWIGTAALARLPVYGKRAVAICPSVLWALSAQAIRTELAGRGELALYLLESLAARLQDAWTQGSSMADEDCRHRIIKTLLRFSTSAAAQPTGESVTVQITHSQLAQAVGAARETVSACLTELRLMNVVHTGRNRLRFNPRQLRELELAPGSRKSLARSRQDCQT